jgi:hypothetical protein
VSIPQNVGPNESCIVFFSLSLSHDFFFSFQFCDVKNWQSCTRGISQLATGGQRGMQKNK